MADLSPDQDTFICGTCKLCYTDLDGFLDHKRSSTCRIAYGSFKSESDITVIQTTAKNLAQAVHSPSTPKQTETTKKPIRKSWKKSLPKDIIIVPPIAPKPDEDGMYKCHNCNERFRRERQYMSHRCFATGDYLNTDRLEGLGDESGADSPKSKELHVNLVRLGQSDDLHEYNTMPVSDNDEHSGNEHEKKRKRGRSRKALEESERENLNSNDKPAVKRVKLIADYVIPQCIDDIPDIPVFPNEEARLAFESKEIFAMDTTEIENMFKCHIIEQNVNSDAGGQSIANRNSDLRLYSCNQCDKVFKFLSHCQGHCLAHIDKKPIRCPEDGCNYKCNGKGNLYTHMRKHTGQYYRCRTCEFKSVNKTHLFEHEATHSGIKYSCEICHRDYSTQKSMINHIRKTHCDTDQGKEYLARFTTRKEGPGQALLFECQICDWKFKKACDRDRHLQVHNVSITSNVFICEICGYEAVKQTQLHTHIMQHAFIYRCIHCMTGLPSSILLLKHLREHHSDTYPDELPTVPDDCLEISFIMSSNKHVKTTSGDDSVLTGTSQTASENPLQQASDIVEAAINTEEDQRYFYTKLGFVAMTQSNLEAIRSRRGDHECELCGNWFQSEETLNDHMNVHVAEKPFACVYCSHRTASRNSLKTHISARHMNEQFNCSQCGFESRSHTAVLEHMDVHDIQSCHICDAECNGRRALRDHLYEKHPEISALQARLLSGYGHKSHHHSDIAQQQGLLRLPYRPFKCQHCNYSCKTRGQLVSHMIRHSEVKPFHCKVCGKNYKSRTALRWHVRSHSEGAGFKCPQCDYTGEQRSHLKRHLETHTVKKKFSCQHCVYYSNTIGCLRLHYTKSHPGCVYEMPISGDLNAVAADDSVVDANADPDVQVFKCTSCDYLFGNMSDIKRHLRDKHSIHVTNLKKTNVASNHPLLTQFVPVENVDGITSMVQVVELPVETIEELENSTVSQVLRTDSSPAIILQVPNEAGYTVTQRMTDSDTQDVEYPTQVVLRYDDQTGSHENQNVDEMVIV